MWPEGAFVPAGEALRVRRCRHGRHAVIPDMESRLVVGGVRPPFGSTSRTRLPFAWGNLALVVRQKKAGEKEAHLHCLNNWRSREKNPGSSASWWRWGAQKALAGEEK